VGGDVYVASPASGVVLRSPDGTVCRRLGVNDDGTLSTTAVPCP